MSRDQDKASGRTVVVALLANLAATLAKGGAALLTGSAAMFAETAHSVADTLNELLLYIGLRSSERPPDSSHPEAYGSDQYFWSLLSAVGIFVAGGVVAVAEGVHAMVHPRSLESVRIGMAVLVVCGIFEGWSWVVARRQLAAEARERSVGLPGLIGRTSDPAPVTVFFEDTAALVGIVLALTGLGLHAWTGAAVYDSLASLAVGVLLIVVAVRLVMLNRRLIIGASASPETVQRAVGVAIRHHWVADVASPRVLVVGPRRVSVSLDVRVRDGLSVPDLVRHVAELRQELLDQDGVVLVDITLVPDGWEGTELSGEVAQVTNHPVARVSADPRD